MIDLLLRQYPSQSHHAREPVRGEIVVTLPRAIATARGSVSAIGGCEDWPEQSGIPRWLQLVFDLLVSCGRAARCNGRGTPPAFSPGRRRSRRRSGQGTPDGSFPLAAPETDVIGARAVRS
jgi:hypothetical protein